ncbi:MAG: hypothetical protein ABSG43_22630 [Solirubrobacteraceae bacterium]
MHSALRRKPRFALLSAAVVVIALGVVVALVVSSHGPSKPRVATTTPTSPVAPAGERLFATDSIWNAAIPAPAPVDPASGQLVGALEREVTSELRRGIGPWIATSKASTPIYQVPAGQPTVRVALDDPTLWWRVSLQAAFAAVPIPAGAQPATGPDAQMTIWQPSTDKLWEFFHMRKQADGWHAAWGGAIEDVSQSAGYYSTGSWPGALPQWGATATSLPVAAGVITLADLRRGQIDHALAIDLPAPRQGVFAWPAQRSDGTGGPDTIPEGAQLRLDPAVDLARLSLPPLTRMIAQAAQTYGIIVRDQTHDGISFYAQDAAQSGGDDLYYGAHGIFGGRTPTQLLAAFPWSDLQVLQMHLCSRAPCEQ